MRKAQVKRKTEETQISVNLNIDGKGKTKINTGIGILNHMLELLAFHGFFDLEITARGDLKKLDLHHTNEDMGIVLGEAFKKALKEKKGIRRFGFASVPMEDVVASIVLDISGRATFRFYKPTVGYPDVKADKEGYTLTDAQHFLESFAKHLGMNLNITLNPISQDLHTNLEPVFKALGIALDKATQIDPRRTSIPSTKGIID